MDHRLCTFLPCEPAARSSKKDLVLAIMGSMWLFSWLTSNAVSEHGHVQQVHLQNTRGMIQDQSPCTTEQLLGFSRNKLNRCLTQNHPHPAIELKVNSTFCTMLLLYLGCSPVQMGTAHTPPSCDGVQGFFLCGDHCAHGSLTLFWVCTLVQTQSWRTSLQEPGIASAFDVVAMC